ncbi:MAG: hypothetical protein KDD60_05995 [Bdellovibrionales bacterium]|nr:hypothetical protein [Bdellovibrionales bacterium]
MIHTDITRVPEQQLPRFVSASTLTQMGIGPFVSLQANSPSSGSTLAGRILSNTKEALTEWEKMCLVCTDPAGTVMELTPEVIAEMHQAVIEFGVETPNSIFYLLASDGAYAARGSTRNSENLEILGGFTEQYSQDLAQNNARHAGVLKDHLSDLGEILQIGTNEIILEVDVRGDFERVRTLCEICDNSDGSLVCFDIVPKAAEVGSLEFNNSIPFISVPHRREHLGSLFRGLDLPITMTSHNLLTHCSRGTSLEFIGAAQEMKCKKIVLAHSAGLSDECQVYPMNFGPSGGGVDRFIQNKLGEFTIGLLASGGLPNRALLNPCLAVLHDSYKTTYQNIMLC